MPGPEKFIRVQVHSSGFRTFLAIETKFGTLMKFNEHDSMLHVIS